MSDQAATTKQPATNQQSADQQAADQQVQRNNGNGSPETTRAGPVLTPPTDIIETKEGVLLLLDMPGADPGSLDVTLDRRVLNISARSESSAPEGCALLYGEYQDGSYERSFVVSEPIDAGKIDAEFKDGVLRLNLPKMSLPATKISVKAV